MEKRKIGSLNVSVAGLGCNNFGWRTDSQKSAAVMDAALDAGINFFDTADIYGGGKSEEFIGEWFGAPGAKRDKVVLATKFGMKFDEQRSGAKPAYVRQALEDSLRRLRTDHVDLYQLHQPDKDTPLEDTIAAMQDLVKSGKVREIGCSNFTVELLKQAAGAFASVQNHYSLLFREPESGVLPFCAENGIAFIPYFPLANGLLSGKYRRGQPFPTGSRGGDGWGPKVFTEENLTIVEAVEAYAKAHGHSMLELAMSWLASKRGVASVIAGAKTPDQARANAIAADWKMTEKNFEEIDSLTLAAQ